MSQPNPALRRSIAATLLHHPLDAEGFSRCPGEAKHTHKSGPRDFRVLLDGAPTGTCFHTSCGPEVDAFNYELRRKIGTAEDDRQKGAQRPNAPLGASVPPPPTAQRKTKRPPFELSKLERFAAAAPASLDAEWLRLRSPHPLPPFEMQGANTARLFLDTLYQPRERVLVFARYWSQGDFLHEIGRGTFRLGAQPDVQAIPSPMPDGGPEGIWFLMQPVSGKWEKNAYGKTSEGVSKLGRRHSSCVASWRFLLLESDTAPADLWLRAAVLLSLPVVAIYSSGGKSYHVLIRVDASSKAEWDALRDTLLPILAPLGADPAAMTAVRLSRLPGMLRHGTTAKNGDLLRYPAPRRQVLLWLNPHATTRPILDSVSLSPTNQQQIIQP